VKLRISRGRAFREHGRREVPESRLIRACRWLIDAGSRFAPGWRRADWRQEWHAELHYRASRLEAHGRLTHGEEIRLLFRCLGSAFHLLFLWKHHWSLDMLTQDIRYAVRMLRRRPTFSAVAIVTLALGIGATTAMFSAVHAVLLKPLPYPQPDRLVRLYGRDTRPGQESIGNLSVPDVMDVQRQATSFAAVGAHNYGGYFTLTGRGEPERLGRLLVTSGYFTVLGTHPELGRLFRPDEDRPNPSSVVVVSYGFWMRRFGADPAIIGKSVVLSGVSATIVGVLPPGFVHPDPHIEATPEVFALLDTDEQVSPRSGRYARAIARLNDDQSISERRYRSRGHRVATWLAISDLQHWPDRSTEATPCGRRQRVHVSVAVTAGGDHRHSADRVRESREPAARCGLRPRRRVDRAHGSRRQSRSDRATTADRESRALKCRRRARNPARLVGHNVARKSGGFHASSAAAPDT
jgi:hypothetical protein